MSEGVWRLWVAAGGCRSALGGGPIGRVQSASTGALYMLLRSVAVAVALGRARVGVDAMAAPHTSSDATLARCGIGGAAAMTPSGRVRARATIPHLTREVGRVGGLGACALAARLYAGCVVAARDPRA
jgi:hypothetical protein